MNNSELPKTYKEIYTKSDKLSDLYIAKAACILLLISSFLYQSVEEGATIVDWADAGVNAYVLTFDAMMLLLLFVVVLDGNKVVSCIDLIAPCVIITLHITRNDLIWYTNVASVLFILISAVIFVYCMYKRRAYLNNMYFAFIPENRHAVDYVKEVSSLENCAILYTIKGDTVADIGVVAKDKNVRMYRYSVMVEISKNKSIEFNTGNSRLELIPDMNFDKRLVLW